MITIIEKRKYETPQLMQIMLDNEISLVLMSSESDPGDPNASILAPEHFNNNPFCSNFG